MKLCGAFLKDQRGVTAIEYVLIASFLALAIIVGATTLGTTLSATFTSIATAFPAG